MFFEKTGTFFWRLFLYTAFYDMFINFLHKAIRKLKLKLKIHTMPYIKLYIEMSLIYLKTSVETFTCETARQDSPYL